MPILTRDIQEISLPYLKCELRDNELNILQSTVQHDGELHLYSYTTRLSKSSVSRICKELESRGLLELAVKGREMFAESTLAGELVCGSVERKRMGKTTSVNMGYMLI